MCNSEEENWRFEHKLEVSVAKAGMPLTSIDNALNEGAEGEPQIMFNALGECFVVCHIKRKKQKADLPLPMAVEVERSDS